MLEEISWHGKNYKSACQRTIELLLKHGANPTRLTSNGHSALELASQWGQGFAISFLEPFLTQNFVPTASIFRTCIKHAIVRGDTEVFDALINITRKVTPIVLDDISLLSFVSTRSDSTHFLTTLLDSGVQVGQPQGTTIFEQALAQGNYEIATLFHDRGLFDPICYDRFDFDLGSVKEGRFTVLGKLLISTIFSSSLLRAVHFVLERLPYEDTSSTEPSPAFWIERKDHLSALHLAAFIHEFRKDLTKDPRPWTSFSISSTRSIISTAGVRFMGLLRSTWPSTVAKSRRSGRSWEKTTLIDKALTTWVGRRWTWLFSDIMKIQI
jgi:hypothetical protein